MVATCYGIAGAISYYMALLVKDKTNSSYRFPVSKIGVVPAAPSVGGFPAQWQWLFVPLVALGGIALSSALVLLSLRSPLFSFPLLIGIATAFVLARFWGIFAAGIYICVWLYILHFVPLFAPNHVVALANGFESSLLYIGAGCVGAILRERNGRVARLQGECDTLQTAVEAAKVRQQSFLRDILTAVTSHRLILCESSTDLPEPLPFAPGEEPVPLASAMLSEVRSRIRKAGSFAHLSESVIGDLVIAGSEASLNAVVHATGGVAEIRADTRGCLQVWVRDCGTGIDHDFLHRAILEAGFSSKGTLGQGFSLIVSTCHRVYLLTGSTGTTIVLETEVS